ncbi:MAG: magnesium transporter CorA family protein [Proteobacteria bacterium]|jgi:magnesium transporter|nr:magnesium transporter CorA family protein [Pseudomonadota bacterium]
MLDVLVPSAGNGLVRGDEIAEGCWINLVAPTEDEIRAVQERLGIEPDLLRYPLDSEERSRVEIEEDQILVTVDIPIIKGTQEYATIPLGIVLKGDTIVTVCLKPNPILDEFTDSRVKACSPRRRNRFVFQILMKTATYYLRYLKTIHKVSEEIEDDLQRAMKNTGLVVLMALEKSLVYFGTSLRGNELVLEKLARLKSLAIQEEDEELLQDVIIENKQAIEMSAIYTGILGGMTSAFASIISNNMARVVKFLTVVTIMIAIPTMVAGYFGMNLELPGQHSRWAFSIVAGASLAVSIALGFILGRLKIG